MEKVEVTDIHGDVAAVEVMGDLVCLTMTDFFGSRESEFTPKQARELMNALSEAIATAETNARVKN